jgi:DNA (cytosine-5)-methyltransferase 1
MNHASIFSGIGGDDLAAEWMGWTNVFHCELIESKRKWLSHRWPKAISYADIRQTNFNIHRGQIDILTGGDPCQVSSKIGKREGMGGGLYMWPEFFRTVCESQPFFVVNENVDGTISNGILDQKIYDLESIGYSCWPPLVIPASFIGASHRRDRVWLVAHSTERRLERRECCRPERQWENKIGPITSLLENKNGTVMPKPEFLQDNDGISDWVDEIQGYGNAIVPQVAYKIFQAIENYVSYHLAQVEAGHSATNNK